MLLSEPFILLACQPRVQMAGHMLLHVRIELSPQRNAHLPLPNPHTYILSSLPTYLPTYQPTYLRTHLPTDLPTNLACLPTYLPDYLSSYLSTNLPSHLPTYLLT